MYSRETKLVITFIDFSKPYFASTRNRLEGEDGGEVTFVNGTKFNKFRKIRQLCTPPRSLLGPLSRRRTSSPAPSPENNSIFAGGSPAIETFLWIAGGSDSARTLNTPAIRYIIPILRLGKSRRLPSSALRLLLSFFIGPLSSRRGESWNDLCAARGFLIQTRAADRRGRHSQNAESSCRPLLVPILPGAIGGVSGRVTRFYYAATAGAAGGRTRENAPNPDIRAGPTFDWKRAAFYGDAGISQSREVR